MVLKLSSVLLVLLSFSSFGQCPDGNVVLLSQSDVDDFQVSYPNCYAIEGFLIIQGSDIVSLSPLSQINTVGSILIEGTSVSSMQDLEALTIAGLAAEDAFIVLDNNPLILDLNFLDNYTINLPIVFLIRDMSGLTSLDGAGNITDFVTIYLENNDALLNINGLNPNLNIVGGIVQSPLLFISNNQSLVDISRLNTVQWNNSLTSQIEDNAQLAICENNLVCSLIENDAIVISNNASGCNTVEEVEQNCGDLSLNSANDNSFKIYPIPTSSKLFFEGLDTEILTSIKIYSTRGRAIIETDKITPLDISSLQSGIYIIEIITQKGRFTKRIIKE